MYALIITNFLNLNVMLCVFIKVKFAGHEGTRVEQAMKYTSTLSLTSALDEDGWLIPRPGRCTPGKQTRYPLYMRLGGP